MTTQVTDQTFATEVLQSEHPVLVDLWAEWCGPCKALAPTLDELADEYAGRLKVAKINVDENQLTAQQLGVRSIPALMVFKDGEIVESTVGVQPKAALQALVSPHLAQ